MRLENRMVAVWPGAPAIASVRNTAQKKTAVHQARGHWMRLSRTINVFLLLADALLGDKAMPSGEAVSGNSSVSVLARSLTSAWDEFAIHHALMDRSVRNEHDQQGFRSLQ